MTEQTKNQKEKDIIELLKKDLKRVNEDNDDKTKNWHLKKVKHEHDQQPNGSHIIFKLKTKRSDEIHTDFYIYEPKDAHDEKDEKSSLKITKNRSEI